MRTFVGRNNKKTNQGLKHQEHEEDNAPANRGKNQMRRKR